MADVDVEKNGGRGCGKKMADEGAKKNGGRVGIIKMADVNVCVYMSIYIYKSK